ncbi:GNAT family N-acetyltransferase [Actinoplanes sp. NPDC049548]|uniref:GNAT family N-acetyltransferase n=1 Tax=Actinoplanes sp. NPDC049548 TaxID=3155152 RepID=UPI0034122B24
MEITMLTPASAADGELVATLTAMINVAYADGERGLWRDGAARTSDAEIVGLIEDGQVAVARLGGKTVGFVRLQQPAPDVAELGMLVAGADVKGTGVGRELVRFAEDWARGRGVPTMQLELLVPLEGTHPFKEFLRGWYTRLGFRPVGSGDVADVHPELAPLLAVPCQFLLFRKDLAVTTG